MRKMNVAVNKYPRSILHVLLENFLFSSVFSLLSIPTAAMNSLRCIVSSWRFLTNHWFAIEFWIRFQYSTNKVAQIEMMKIKITFITLSKAVYAASELNSSWSSSIFLKYKPSCKPKNITPITEGIAKAAV